MMDEAERRSWARGRMLDLAEALTPHGAELRQLRRSGVGDHRAAALYPFDFNTFKVGILQYASPHTEKGAGAEAFTSLLTHNHSLITGPSMYIWATGMAELDAALNRADDAAYGAGAGQHLAEVMVLTLKLLATRPARSMTITNPLTGQIMPLRGKPGWEVQLEAFVIIVEKVCALLDSERPKN